MLDKINSNKHFKHFVAYSIIFIVYGMIQIGLGPLIPYLAQRKGISQTQYSFLFLSRSIAFITSGVIIKYLEKMMSLHKLGILGCILAGSFYILFSLTDNLFWLGFFIFGGAMGTCILQISVNMGMLLSHSNNQVQFWMQLNHGMFGIGGLLGPFFVYLFQTRMYIVMSIIIIPLGFIFAILKSPDQPDFHQGQQQEIQKQLVQKKNKKLGQVPTNIQYFICSMFFLYLGLESGVGGWISSYAVIQKVQTKEGATTYSGIFWIAMTIFRFLTPFLPGSISSKLKYCILSTLVSCFISAILALMGQYWLAIIFCAYSVGFSLAAQFPLFLTWPSQYGMQFNTRQTANIMIFSMLGQAGPSVIIGFLMGLFTPNMLFYSLLVVSIILFILFQVVWNLLNQNLSTKIMNDNEQTPGPSFNSKIEMKQLKS